jgi:hypothetical protein
MATLMLFLILSGGNKVYLKSRIFAIYVVSEIYIEVRVGVGTFLPTPTPAAPKLLLTPTPRL